MYQGNPLTYLVIYPSRYLIFTVSIKATICLRIYPSRYLSKNLASLSLSHAHNVFKFLTRTLKSTQLNTPSLPLLNHTPLSLSLSLSFLAISFLSEFFSISAK